MPDSEEVFRDDPRIFDSHVRAYSRGRLRRAGATTRLAEGLGDAVDITLIDRSGAFIFGFSKFDLMFGKKPLVDATQLRYADMTNPHVRFRQETITVIDPEAGLVTTDRPEYTADVLVIALGADYDFAATPGLETAGNEFYSVPGALASGS